MTLAKPDPAAPRPENALDRAMFAAEYHLRQMTTEAGWPQQDLPAAEIAQICVGPAWAVFKQEVSAWNRQGGAV